MIPACRVPYSTGDFAVAGFVWRRGGRSRKKRAQYVFRAYSYVPRHIAEYGIP